MQLSFALFVSTLTVADASVRRELSFEKVAGYTPASQVTDHCAIDLDQAAMEVQLALKTPEAFANARAIYNDGGNSKSYATVSLTDAGGLAAAMTKGDPILANNAEGTQVPGKAYGDYAAGSKEIKVQYVTSDVQESYVGCQVGGLVTTTTTGCFEPVGVMAIGDPLVEHPYAYDVLSQNNNGRSIAGFSTSAGKKMMSCDNCPYTDFKYFYEYYGMEDYAHHWIESAFDGTKTTFKNGNADFSTESYDGKAEYIKKGAAYLNIFMYVIREWEDALDDCQDSCIDCNDSSAHAWDEGVCFYTGSMEGTDGAGNGKLLYALGDKRCKNFKTCGESGTELEGTSKVNHDLIDLMNTGQFQLQQGECNKARTTTQAINKMMYIPMIQGSLRYAYKVSKLQGQEKEKAEGAVFTAAVLPRIHAASAEAAKTIYENMKVGAATTDIDAVKAAYESTYENLGITCEDVGGLWLEAESKYYPGMEPCTNEERLTARGADSAGSRLGMSVVSSLVASVFMYLYL